MICSFIFFFIFFIFAIIFNYKNEILLLINKKKIKIYLIKYTFQHYKKKYNKKINIQRKNILNFKKLIKLLSKNYKYIK